MKRSFQILWESMRLGVYCALALGALIGVFHSTSNKATFPGQFVATEPENDATDFKKIDWRLLREMNHQSGAASKNLQAVDGKRVQIPGFLVPLEDNQNQVTEFLLVPSPQACIHVPPPPPNQMIYVKMRKPIQFDRGYRAYWIQGILSLKTVDSPYGSVSFEMLGEGVKRFNIRNQENDL